MKVTITQSNYIPWKGYFDTIAMSDLFILYDDMQYTKRDWRNRNKIKCPNGTKWLTIPVNVSGKYFQAIKEVTVADSQWKIKHLNMIRENYRSAYCFDRVFPILEKIYSSCETEYLSEINGHFLKEICSFLGIKTKIIYSSQFELIGDKTERLANLCKQVGGDQYLTGPAAKDYMDENVFQKLGIAVEYLDYTDYSTYRQLYGNFDHNLSIVDLILNEGMNSKNFMKHV